MTGTPGSISLPGQGQVCCQGQGAGRQVSCRLWSINLRVVEQGAAPRPPPATWPLGREKLRPLPMGPSPAPLVCPKATICSHRHGDAESAVFLQHLWRTVDRVTGRGALWGQLWASGPRQGEAPASGEEGICSPLMSSSDVAWGRPGWTEDPMGLGTGWAQVRKQGGPGAT